MQNRHKVSVVQIENPKYPKNAPYHPSTNYIEYPFPGCISREVNYVYDGIRQLFFKLAFDREHWNTPEWNPLGHLIKRGMNVVIKPNFVLSQHVENKDIFSAITHPSILRAIIDYCWIALKGKGKISIADVPSSNCNFEDLLETTKLHKVKNFLDEFPGPKIEIFDLRNYYFQSKNSYCCTRGLPGDLEGNISIDLGKESSFYNHLNPGKFCGAAYDRKKTMDHHSGERHIYEISRTIFNADIIIFVPKMKVHKKAGVSLTLKGLVGICTSRNSIVHFTLGTPSQGGDEFPENLFNKIERMLINFGVIMYGQRVYRETVAKPNKRYGLLHRLIWAFLYPKVYEFFKPMIPKEKKMLIAGNWHGNNSVWRMVVDLAKIIYFANKLGRLHDKPQRQLFSIIDGVIGGENNGPNAPDPKSAGVLIGGENILAVDLVATRLMGFDPLKLKQFSILTNSCYDFGPKRLDDIEVISDEPTIQKCLENKKDKFFAFKPYPGWVGHIEI